MILITGSDGQLGREFAKLLTIRKIPFTATSHAELDITDKAAIDDFICGRKTFKVIINCAAYNNVDRAQSDIEKCRAVNTIAPFNLAKACKKTGASFITYSTDFVFGGDKNTPYSEKDEPRPLSVYGQSKLDGENAVLSIYENSYVIRTSWVFSASGQNFLRFVLDKSNNNEEIKAVTDQISAPTHAGHLAIHTLALLEGAFSGLYHISGAGSCSKYELARYILSKIQSKVRLYEAVSGDFNSAARRPGYSKISSDKCEKQTGLSIPHWKEGVDQYLKERGLIKE